MIYLYQQIRENECFSQQLCTKISLPDISLLLNLLGILDKTESSWRSRCALLLDYFHLFLSWHILAVSPTRSEPSQAHLKTSRLLLSDGSLASEPKGRGEWRGEQRGEGRLLCFSHYPLCGVLTVWLGSCTHLFHLNTHTHTHTMCLFISFIISAYLQRWFSGSRSPTETGRWFHTYVRWKVRGGRACVRPVSVGDWIQLKHNLLRSLERGFAIFHPSCVQLCIAVCFLFLFPHFSVTSFFFSLICFCTLVSTCNAPSPQMGKNASYRMFLETLWHQKVSNLVPLVCC